MRYGFKYCIYCGKHRMVLNDNDVTCKSCKKESTQPVPDKYVDFLTGSFTPEGIKKFRKEVLENLSTYDAGIIEKKMWKRKLKRTMKRK